ncbi:MAG: glycoside hydrolase family 3 C-terminal domain-containing protein [Bacilli bacterium]|nr:glycoside hydrolase family 3 C-terminal domain-containing protein [Bacilli bacterium]
MKRKTLIPLFLTGMVLPLALGAALQGQESARAGAAFIGEYTQTQKNEYIKHGEALNSQMANEGFVLLKNDGSLPMKKGSKLSVIGKSSTNLSRGGAGSGSGSITSGVTAWDLQKSLTEAGFVINDSLTEFYKDKTKSGDGRHNGNTSWRGISEVWVGETPMSSYSAELLATLDEYNDAAVQVITREGSEGCDVKAIDCRDNNKTDPQSAKHALELSDNEQALFDEAKKHTDHVIFIINSSNIFECDALMKDPKVAGILWIGNPGDVGPSAIGKILCGDVNPSGHTVDTWTRDFTKDPVFQNWSDNQQHNPAVEGSYDPTATGDSGGYIAKPGYAPMDTMLTPDGKPMMGFGSYKAYTDHDNPPYGADYSLTHQNQQWMIDNKVMPGGVNGVKPAAYVSYEEGIYMDYRYYETKYADMAKTDKTAADAWYNGNEGVVFPFGYGLSYTTFKQEIVRVSPHVGNTLTADDKVIEMSVKVTNTGKVAGKDVVQLYWRAPYYKNGIEKADRVLCAFDKTAELAPGASEVVNLKFNIQDVANYDTNDSNKNGFKGYELDAGTYGVMLGKTAHEAYEEVNFTVGTGGIQYRYDRFTGHEVKNRFTDRGYHNTMPTEVDIEFTEFSRADFAATFPTHPTDADRRVKAGSKYEEFLTHRFDISELDGDKNFDIIPEAAYKTKADADKGGWKQEETTLPAVYRTQLKEMKGVPLGDPKWESFVNEFTWAEMLKVLETNAMASPAINEIGKSRFSEGDGPQKFSIMWWVSSPIVAATWNPRLAHAQGEAIGMEAHINNKSGWWGPGVNTHRSPFGGRNFEYYSADPFLMGRMAAQVIEAVSDAGVYVYLKHFAVNDQEKNREAGISFLNEQTLREIYLKSFQMVFEEARPMGVMSSYNRIGLMETAGSYPLLTEVMRGEWGFKGSVLSDMTHSNNAYIDFGCYENVTERILAGCNAQLDQNGGFGGRIQPKWDPAFHAPVFEQGGVKKVAYSFWYAARKCFIEHMYISANTVAQNRGITQQVDAPDATATVGKYAYYDVEQLATLKLGTEYGGGVIKSIDRFTVENRWMPEGVKFSEGAIYGYFQETGLYRFDIVAHVVIEVTKTVVEDEVETEVKELKDLDLGIALVINVLPDETTPNGLAK